MKPPAHEPILRVGLAEGLSSACISISGGFRFSETILDPGAYHIKVDDSNLVLIDAQGTTHAHGPDLLLEPVDTAECTFTLPENSIGRDFHWQRTTSQTYRGCLAIACYTPGALTLINHIRCEDYLEAVICSEMSPRASAEFLKAHCVISRSWVLAQLQHNSRAQAASDAAWTDAACHAHFDVCNDDHCQRYHGIGAINSAARSALVATHGEVLMSDGSLCDARFSKCCGGITEQFSTCWQDIDYSYLQPRPDCALDRAQYQPPLNNEALARTFIDARPDVFCNVADPALLETILPDFDYETGDFFRWQVNYSQEELRKIIVSKSCDDFGDILSLEPLSRGASGRVKSLRIVGSKHSHIVSKELAIRRILSPSHLYSSAFYVETQGSGSMPQAFVLHGAGWGHGVGLCQIGAAAMAHAGYDHRHILAHYFQGAELKRLY